MCASGGNCPPPREGVNWEGLGFGLTTKDTHIVIAKSQPGGTWQEPQVKPYGPLPLEPSATILNYGQGIFEGMKAYRTHKGRIVLFRPEMNAKRFADGAERFLMPPVPEDLFLKMCGAAVRANADWVPPVSKGELYMRPLLFGSGGGLGVGPSSEYTFVIFVAPVEKPGSASLRLEAQHQRAAPLGVGGVKAAGNYAPCFAAQREANQAGFSDVVYLDVTGKFVEEAASSNLFCLGRDGILRTPELGTILPGITRESIIQLAQDSISSSDGPPSLKGVSVEPLHATALLDAAEIFVTGTGAGVRPISRIDGGNSAAVGSTDLPCPGPVTEYLATQLQQVTTEAAEDTRGWLWDVFSS